MINKIVFLTGIMGAGKSATGKVIASKLGIDFFDTDKIVELLSCKTIKDIFETEGEDTFRKWEHKALLEVCDRQPSIVATGGGLPTWGHNLKMMKDSGIIVTLTTSPDEIYRRVSQSKTVRPLLNCDNPKEEIVSLLQKRAYYYIKSDIIVDTGNKSVSQVSDEIIKRLGL